MACFTVPLAEAVIVTAVRKTVLKKSAVNAVHSAKMDSINKSVGRLEKMLYGGSFLLAVEHLWHGEISFFPPFLTALNTPDEIPVMLRELASVGVGMALLVTGVWALAEGAAALVRRFAVRRKTAAEGESL